MRKKVKTVKNCTSNKPEFVSLQQSLTLLLSFYSYLALNIAVTELQQFACDTKEIKESKIDRQVNEKSERKVKARTAEQTHGQSIVKNREAVLFKIGTDWSASKSKRQQY